MRAAQQYGERPGEWFDVVRDVAKRGPDVRRGVGLPAEPWKWGLLVVHAEILLSRLFDEVYQNLKKMSRLLLTIWTPFRYDMPGGEFNDRK
jgi:hypothetical protein